MEKPENNLYVQLTRQMFTELAIHSCDDWMSKVQGDKPEPNHSKSLSYFDQEQEKGQLADQLYQQYDYIIVDNEDNYYGIKGEFKEFIQYCKGSWQQVLEHNLL